MPGPTDPLCLTIALCGEIVGLELADLGESALKRIETQFRPFLVEAQSPDWRLKAERDATVQVDRGEADLSADQLGLVRFHHRSSLLKRDASNPSHFLLRHAWDDARPLENALRAITSERLLRLGGGLFHAAAIEWRGMGWLFPGVSGAGKSTLCNKAGRPAVLCDEMPAILPDPAGGWRVFATPFHGDYGPSERGDSLPLAGIALLDGKDEEQAAVAPALLASQRLLACLVRYGKPDDAGLDLATQLVAALQTGPKLATLRSRIDEPFSAIMARLESLLAGNGKDF